MSKQISFDRAKGFVALPVEILEIDMSPGAFRVLVELCRMANLEGYCWPSLDQLGDRIGRSKAAVSGYLKELRTADLLRTIEQKTATGYNYRLKFQLTFWEEWRASLRGRTASKPERSVQPDERPKKDKNHIHLNQVTPAAVGETEILLKGWADCFRGAPYPAVNSPPSRTLVTDTLDALGGESREMDISADIKSTLGQVWAQSGVEVAPDLLMEQVRYVARSGIGSDELGPLEGTIRIQWKPHWRKPPTFEQFKKLVSPVCSGTQKQKLELLSGYIRRWEKAQSRLRLRGEAGSVTSKQCVAA